MTKKPFLDLDILRMPFLESSLTRALFFGRMMNLSLFLKMYEAFETVSSCGQISFSGKSNRPKESLSQCPNLRQRLVICTRRGFAVA